MSGEFLLGISTTYSDSTLEHIAIYLTINVPWSNCLFPVGVRVIIKSQGSH